MVNVKNVIGKAFLIELRNWPMTLVEIIVLTVCLVVLIINPQMKYSSYEVDEKDLDRTKIYEQNFHDNLSIFSDLVMSKEFYKLAYAPANNLIVRNIINNVVDELGLMGSEEFEDNDDLESNFNANFYIAGVIFDYVPSGNFTINNNTDTFDNATTENPMKSRFLSDELVPPNLEEWTRLYVTLRFPYAFRTFESDNEPDNYWVTRCDGKLTKDDNDESNYIQTDLYIREGFLQLQHSIFTHWTREINYEPLTVDDPPMRSFRHYADTPPCLNPGNSNIPGFLLYFCYLLPFLFLVYRYGRESQENVVAYHWRYGISPKIYWLTNMFVSLLHFLVLDVIATFILKFPWLHGSDEQSSGVLTDANFLLVFLVLLLHSLALIIFAAGLVLALWNARNAVLLGAILWLANYGVWSVLISCSSYMTFIVGLIIFMFFNNALPYAVMYMKRLMEYDDQAMETLILLMVMLLNVIVLYLIFCALVYKFPGRYMDTYVPGCLRCCKNRRPKTKNKNKSNYQKMTSTFTENMPEWHNFEHGPLGVEEIVRIKNLCAEDGDEPSAKRLQNIDMRMYRGEITAIVGPKNAGKTLLICVLAGWKKPTYGTVYFNNYNLFVQKREARRLVDVSMEQPALFDHLTVIETLQYYTYIKTRTKDKAQVLIEVQKWWEVLNSIIPKKKLLVRKMKWTQRKFLALCVAMTGGTKVVLLEEPTEHMHMSEKRLFWNILQQEKADRSIIFTTYSLDDAEHIADRMAILDNGILRTYGSQYFLRSKYGDDYDLIFLLEPRTPVEPITLLLRKYMSSIEPHAEIGQQLIYKLPRERRPQFQRILIALETESSQLGIKSIKVLDAEMGTTYSSLLKRNNNQIISDDYNIRREDLLTGKALCRQQLNAMLYKKLLNQVPNVWPIVLFLVAFILLIIIAWMSQRLDSPEKRDNSIMLGMNMNLYGRNVLDNVDITCDFLEITKVDRDFSFIKTNAPRSVFADNSLRCGEGEYRNKIMEDTRLLKQLGALEDGNIMYFNQHLFHMAPLVLNLYHNFVLNNYFGDSDYMAYITNHPMPLPLTLKVPLRDNIAVHTRLAIILGVSIPIIVCAFIFAYVHERRSNLLFLHTMADVSMCLYWFVNFLWDWLTFIIFMIIFVIALSFFLPIGFPLELTILIYFLTVLYGASALVLIYCISSICYKWASTAFLTAYLLYVTLGICIYVFYWDVIFVNSSFYYLAMFFSPTFAYLDGVSNVYAEGIMRIYCQDMCENNNECDRDSIDEALPRCEEKSLGTWSPPGVMPCVVFLLIAALLYGAIMFLVHLIPRELNWYSRRKMSRLRSAAYSYDDPEMIKIKQEIAEMDTRNLKQLRFVVDQLERRIPKKSDELHTISFRAVKSSCLGIYGCSHSGKKYLARQLVGERGYVFGDIYCCGYDMKYERKMARRYLGYCPRSYGFYESCTPREMMRLFCMMHGMPGNMRAERIKDIALRLDMGKFMDKKICTLDFECKRKVAIAVSLVTLDKVLILDEPTKGLHPSTASEIWNVLRYERSRGKTIIFTSSNPTECCVLADNVLIYDRGEMYAYGNMQSLRSTYTKGFYLTVKLRRDGATAYEVDNNFQKDVENCHRFMTFLHDRAELITRTDNCLRFYVPVEHVKYSYLFGAMEKNRRRINIVDYTVTQGSMEDVMRNLSGKRTHQ